MALNSLLERLERRAVTPVTSEKIPDVTPRPAPILACTPVTSVTAENDETKGKATCESQSNPAMEARRQRVLTMLAEYPAIRIAVICDSEGDPVPVAIGIRDKGTCEVMIPAARFDRFALIELVGRHGKTVH